MDKDWGSHPVSVDFYVDHIPYLATWESVALQGWYTTITCTPACPWKSIHIQDHLDWCPAPLKPTVQKQDQMCPLAVCNQSFQMYWMKLLFRVHFLRKNGSCPSGGMPFQLLLASMPKKQPIQIIFECIFPNSIILAIAYHLCQDTSYISITQTDHVWIFSSGQGWCRNQGAHSSGENVHAYDLYWYAQPNSLCPNLC